MRELIMKLAQKIKRARDAAEYSPDDLREWADYLESIAKAQAEPAGETGTMPGTSGFTMAAFEAEKVPVGTKLYISAPPSPAVTGLVEAFGRLMNASLRMVQANNLSEAQVAVRELNSAYQSSEQALAEYHGLTELESESAAYRSATPSTQLDQLLFAVERKFPGESRFETALRYIRESEARACQSTAQGSSTK